MRTFVRMAGFAFLIVGSAQVQARDDRVLHCYLPRVCEGVVSAGVTFPYTTSVNATCVYAGKAHATFFAAITGGPPDAIVWYVSSETSPSMKMTCEWPKAKQ